jgi:hypothetical protein
VTVARLADVVLVVLLVETALLWLTSAGTSASARWQWVANGAAGFCLVLALRASATDSATVWVLMALLGALLAHLADLWLRRRLVAGR